MVALAPTPVESQPEPTPVTAATPSSAPAQPATAVAPARKRPKVSGFAEFETQLGRLDGAFTTILGGSGAVVLFDRLILGGSGYGMAYLDRSYPGLDGDRRLELGYGGALLGVFTARKRVISSSFNVMLGGGRACLRFTSNERNCDTSANIFVSQVELALYVKMSSFARVGFSFGYRFVGAAEDWAGPGNWDLAGGYGAFKLAFGKF